MKDQDLILSRQEIINIIDESGYISKHKGMASEIDKFFDAMRRLEADEMIQRKGRDNYTFTALGYEVAKIGLVNWLAKKQNENDQQQLITELEIENKILQNKQYKNNIKIIVITALITALLSNIRHIIDYILSF